MPNLSRRWQALALALLLLAGVTACTNVAEAAPKPTPTAIRTPRALPTATPRPMPTATRAVKAAPTAKPTTLAAEAISIAFTEAELNQQLDSIRDDLEEQGISDAAVRLDPGVLVLSGRAKVGIFSAELEVHLKVATKDGELKPTVTKVLMNGGAAPAFVQNQVAEGLAAGLTIIDPRFYVETVTITGDEVQITGRQ